jgi:rRNA-processing protein FCF1
MNSNFVTKLRAVVVFENLLQNILVRHCPRNGKLSVTKNAARYGHVCICTQDTNFTREVHVHNYRTIP